jgi:hypothetical protein
MKALKNKKHELTAPFRKLIKSTIDKLRQHEMREVANFGFYFEVNDDCLGQGYDICEHESCITEAKRKLRKEFGKKKIESVLTFFDGDNEDFHYCWICDKPLHERLTYAEDKLDWFYTCEYDWNKSFLEAFAFELRVILESMPTSDYYINHRCYETAGPALNMFLEKRSAFYAKVEKLAKSINKTL